MSHGKFFTGLALSLSLLLLARAREREVEVDVVVDMTDAGRKVIHPDSAHPAYYLPVVGGFKQGGDVVQGEKAPPPREVIHLVAVALARQGYLVAKPAPGVNQKGEIIYADDTVVTVPAQFPVDRRITFNAPGNVPLTMKMLEAPAGPYSVMADKSAAPGGPASVIAKALRVVDPVHGPIMRGLPSLVVAIHWGALNPVVDDPSLPIGSVQAFEGGPVIQNNFYNEDEMLALVGGSAVATMATRIDSDDLRSASLDDRYFVIITAYDFKNYQQRDKRVLLWQAKMSVPSSGSDFHGVMATLVKAGEPFLGRETDHPKMLYVPVTPEGTVTIGTPVITDYKDAPAPNPLPPAKSK